MSDSLERSKGLDIEKALGIQFVLTKCQFDRQQILFIGSLDDQQFFLNALCKAAKKLPTVCQVKKLKSYVIG